MLRWLLHLALIAAVVGCPLGCRIDALLGAAPAAGPSASRGCCPHCRVQPAREAPAERTAPVNDAPERDHGLCQCFCGGGVLAATMTVSLDDTRSLDAVNFAAALAPWRQSDLGVHRGDVDPWRFAARSAGRDFCRRQSRWLC